MLLLAAWAHATDLPLAGSAEVVTAFPTDVGLRGVVEGPGRLRLVGSAGLMPRAYLGAINDVATGAGWYSDTDAEIIEVALQDALVLRAHLGWRPWARQGFQFELGYGWVGLGGGFTGAELIEAYTGYDLSAFAGDKYSFSAGASLHRAEASLGWEHPLWRGLFLRWDLGASYTFAATAEVEREFDANVLLEGALDRVQDDAEAELVTILEQYVHTPIVGLGVGWRFE